MPIIAGTGLSAAAQGGDYMPAPAAPAAWQAFAVDLQRHLQERLSADDEATRRFREFMARSEKASSVSVVVRVWIAQNGKVERIEFDGIDDAGSVVNLRALLAGTTVGAPPSDMHQPLHLRLALRARDEQDH